MTKFFMRFFGVVNLLFVGLGIWYAVGMLYYRLKAGRWPPYAAVRLDWILYFVFLTACFALMIWFSYLSVRLIRADRNALLPTCIVFGVEIVYLFVDSVFFFFVPDWVTNRSWFWTMGMDPVVPQLAYYYPFVAILVSVALFLTTRNMQRPSRELTTPLS